ncbi:hypothetical protein B0T13DRAFT_392196, partial [Neurospora crassa]
IIRITKEVRSEVFAEYSAIKRANFNTIASFFTYYISFRKRIENATFKIDNDFKITFLYNAIKSAYPINTKF